MKKFYSGVVIIVLTLLILTSPAMAEPKFEVGPKAGLNFATITGSSATFDGEGAGFIVRGNAGALISVAFTDKLALQTEFLFNQKGAKWEYSISSNDTTWNYKRSLGFEYIEISLLAKFTIPTSGKIQPFLFTGPAIAFNISSEAKDRMTIDSLGIKIYDLGDDYIDDIPITRSTLFEGVLGAGMEIKLGSGKLSLESRYTFSFDKILDDGIFIAFDPDGEGLELKHSVFSILIGYSFPLAL